MKKLLDNVGGRKWALCLITVFGVFACAYAGVELTETMAETIKWTLIAYLPANVLQKKLLQPENPSA